MAGSEPDAIEPDTKDWTWVLQRPCPECGFDAGAFDVGRTAVTLRDNAGAWARRLDGDEAALRRRPDPATWSVLEYACHVRDVFRVFDGRLVRMLTEDDPAYANWDQDATAVESRYGEQQPGVVAAELRDAAAVLADRFDGVAGDQWARTGRRSDGAAFTVESLARYLVHDPVHHLHDVGGSAAASGA
jgi:hypothetical protein